MSPFWSSFFTHLKDCGRDTTLFVITFAGLFLLIILATIFCGENLPKYALRALPGIVVFFLAWAGVALSRARARRRQRLERGPLSFDELRKARSRLVRSHKGN